MTPYRAERSARERRRLYRMAALWLVALAVYVAVLKTCGVV